jgi:phosphate transport system substrate-binding protein
VTKNKIGALAGVVLLALGLAACGSSSKSSSSSSSASSSPSTTSSSSGSGTISGAGSTFAAPVYEQWASAQSGLTVNYQAVGSGAGITSLESKTVDFGASDPPLKPADEAAIAKNGSPAVQIPMFLGAITVSYNLPGVKTGLKLDGKTIADIYLGKVKTWNDAEIKALNPGVNLPSTAITVIHRSDSSGTTAGFTGFLAAVDPAFKSKVGEGKDVQWPTGTGAKGNAGVAGAVQQTTGAVGYVEQAYALQHNFTYASVKNKAGSFVAPTLASASAAATGVKVPANLGVKISNPGGAGSYPITSQTFIVVNKDLCKAGLSESVAKGVVKFIDYGLGQGQSILSQADYAGLPASILTKSKAAAASLECNGSPLGG